MSEKELKPCPFCGQQEAFVEQLDSDASVVICQGMVDEHSACLARGPVGVQQSDMEDQPGRDAAIAEWNRRAQPAEADGFQIARHSKRLVEQLRAEVEALRKAQSAEARAGDMQPDTVRVSAEPLRMVLNALVNAPHRIRELQVTREPVALFADNPINVLIAEFNAAAMAAKEGES